MEHIAQRLAETPEGVTSVEFARRAGVGRTTIHRIANGESEPSLGTLRELAIVHGYDLELTLVPLSDPTAAAALRHLVDPAFSALPPSDIDASTADAVDEWMTRLRRYPDTDHAAVAAARASSLLYRRGARVLRGDRSAARLASAGDASGAHWALSGAAGLSYVTGNEVDGVAVLWVDRDPDEVSRYLLDTHRSVENAAAAQVIVARAHPSVFVDEHRGGPFVYVAPTQLLLDSIGLGGLTEATALLVQHGWSMGGS